MVVSKLIDFIKLKIVYSHIKHMRLQQQN